MEATTVLLGLGTSRAQVPFAEQIHVHLSSMKMRIFFCCVHCGIPAPRGQPGTYSQFLLNKCGRRKEKSFEGQEQL